MTLTLFVITLVAGISLGFINDLTIGPKAKAKLERKVNALKEVLPNFDNNPVGDVVMIKSEKAKDSIEIYPAFLGENSTGTAIVGSSENGYSGLVKIMVGFNPDKTIQNIVVLEQKETPGLGTKMKDDKFIRQLAENCGVAPIWEVEAAEVGEPLRPVFRRALQREGLAMVILRRPCDAAD